MRILFLLICLLQPMLENGHAAEALAVADGINQFGLDLHTRLAAKGGNVVFSPWSIETALAMTYAGAAGNTKLEMRRCCIFQRMMPPLIKVFRRFQPTYCFRQSKANNDSNNRKNIPAKDHRWSCRWPTGCSAKRDTLSNRHS